MTKNPLILIGAGWIVFVLVVAAGLPLTRGAGPPPFDQSLWLAHANTTDANPRREMIDSIKKQLPPGTSKAEVEALLGSPNWFSGAAMVYFIGNGTPSDRRPYLVIHFDNDRRVARFSNTFDY